MSITITLPEPIEAQLKEKWHNLPRRTLEALAIQGYREEILSIGQLAEMLGLSVIQAESFLKEKGVDLPYTLEDLNQDRAASRQLLMR